MQHRLQKGDTVVGRTFTVFTFCSWRAHLHAMTKPKSCSFSLWSVKNHWLLCLFWLTRFPIWEKFRQCSCPYIHPSGSILVLCLRKITVFNAARYRLDQSLCSDTAREKDKRQQHQDGKRRRKTVVGSDNQERKKQHNSSFSDKGKSFTIFQVMPIVIYHGFGSHGAIDRYQLECC